MIEIKPVCGKRSTRDWLSVPIVTLAHDPNWVQPLNIAEMERLSPKHNPFFANGEAVMYVGYKDGKPAGRISAQVNRSHLERYQDGTGHFGFFDCINDAEVAAALTGAARVWLKERKLSRMVGPFGFDINQDAGLLVSGFEHRPAVMTSHANVWTGALLERCGLEKVVDLYAYRMSPHNMPPQITRLAGLAKASGRVKVRNIDTSRFYEEAALLFDIFNDAWSDNWGYLPISEKAGRALAAEVRPVMRSKFGWIAEIDGKPAAMMVLLPDVNEVIGPFRVIMLGIRKEHRATFGASVLSMMVTNIMELSRQYDIDWVEFSWVVETNRQMMALAELAAGKPAKTYRLYGCEL